MCCAREKEVSKITSPAAHLSSTTEDLALLVFNKQ